MSWFRDTLFLRLFVLMWVALVASHVAAFGIVTSGWLPFDRIGFEARGDGEGHRPPAPVFPSLPPMPGLHLGPPQPGRQADPGSPPPDTAAHRAPHDAARFIPAPIREQPA